MAHHDECEQRSTGVDCTCDLLAERDEARAERDRLRAALAAIAATATLWCSSDACGRCARCLARAATALPREE